MNTQQAVAILKDPAKVQEELKKLFETLDKDKKGYLEPEVLKNVLMNKAVALGFPPVEPDKAHEDALKQAADPNNTGKVDLNGFMAAQKKAMDFVKDLFKDADKRNKEIKRIFEKLDADKKGYLDIAKIKELDKKVDQLGVPILYKPTEEEKKKLIAAGDPNNTGKLNLEGCYAIGNKIADKAKADGLI